MKAILLAAGLGTRLRPLTDSIPKCLVPINGIPILQHWFKWLERTEISEILVNLHHHSSKVRQIIQESDTIDKITTVVEPELLGTAGTIRANAEFCRGKSTFVAHADNYCLSDLNAFIAAHKNRPPDTEISMLTFLGGDPRSCGIVEINEEKVAVGFHEKVRNPPGNLANGAVYIFEPTVIDEIESVPRKTFDITTEILPRYLKRIYTWPADGAHIDIGTPAGLAQARSVRRT
jgi:mannose-1-phosphate guanylyltransferase